MNFDLTVTTRPRLWGGAVASMLSANSTRKMTTFSLGLGILLAVSTCKGQSLRSELPELREPSHVSVFMTWTTDERLDVETQPYDVESRLRDALPEDTDVSIFQGCQCAAVVVDRSEILNIRSKLDQRIRIGEGITFQAPQTRDARRHKIEAPVVGRPHRLVSNLRDGSQLQGATLAILDSGIYSGHETFDDVAIEHSACFSDGNSDYETTCLAPDDGENCSIVDNKACDHGTKVASIMVDAISPTEPLTFVPIKVATIRDKKAVYQAKDVLAAFEYLRALKVDEDISVSVANLSVSYPKTCEAAKNDNDVMFECFECAIRKLWSEGVAVVVSSGNDGWKGALAYPACLKETVSVASYDPSNHMIKSTANSSNALDFVAPGENISVAVAGTQDDYALSSGTSLAAPHIAGLWGRYSDVPDQTEQALIDCATDLDQHKLIEDPDECS